MLRQRLAAIADTHDAGDRNRRFAETMATQPIALVPDKANEQHYEVPAEFFALVLGPHRKYSSCLYRNGTTGLADALAESCAHAALVDGQDVPELGCGWGSLTLWMAAHYPKSWITAVSNSDSQRAFIETQAETRGLGNVQIVTRDMNDFDADATYDRIVSIEMFEHMSNWRDLLTRARRWLRDDGRFFMHIFTHKDVPYRFLEDGAGNFFFWSLIGGNGMGATTRRRLSSG